VLRLAVADGPNKLVGITEQAIFLADKVIAPSDTTDLKVFSVVGFGGLGKTTLVMEVCRHLESHFQRRAQVSVSQVLDLKALLRSVLHQILEAMQRILQTIPSSPLLTSTAWTLKISTRISRPFSRKRALHQHRRRGYKLYFAV